MLIFLSHESQLVKIVLECFQHLVPLFQLEIDLFELRKECLELVTGLLVVKHEVLVVLPGLIMGLRDGLRGGPVYVSGRVDLDGLGTEHTVDLGHPYTNTVSGYSYFRWTWCTSLARR